MSVETLIAQLHQLEAQRDTYLETINKAQQAVKEKLAKAGESQRESQRESLRRDTRTSLSLEVPVLPSSPTFEAPVPGLTISPPPLSRKPSHIGHGYRDSNPALSNYDASTLTDDSDESEDEELFYVQDHLPTQSFDHEHLRDHLKKYPFDVYGRQILSSVISDKGRLKDPSLFPSHETEDKKNYSHYQVFDVGSDGVPVALATSNEFDQTMPKARQIWLAIKDINAGALDERAVGRITVAREPSPILFGALHLTYGTMFDMDELFRHLVESEASSVHLYRAFDDDERRRRSFVFNFEYYTIIGDERMPMAWQLADKKDTMVSESHLPLSRCSSVVALTLYGAPIKKIRNSARRAKKREGSIYDPWSAWQVINVQCYPDWKAKTDVHEGSKRYVNGPEAFLYTVLAEFKDAQKRFDEIYHQISKLITPPLDFIFNEDARDRRLFEDKDFTYTRRYFWAHQTLGSMNDSIQAMIDAYEDNFTQELWEGRHKTLWPLSEHDQTGRNDYWKKRLRNLKMAFTREIAALRTLQKENNDRRAEIRFLRDQLFSGTSVMESRKSVELSEITIQQGHNIKLLTLVNIFFLPLTFVTSVFGMTNMPTERHYWMFGVTISCICIPFFLLIGSLNTTSGYHWWGSKFRSLFRWARFRLKTAEPVEETVPKKNAPNLDRSWSAEAGMEFRMGQRAEREREKERRHTVIDIPLRPGEKALTLPLPLAETKASDHSTEDSSSKPPDEADKEEGPKGEKREVNW